MGRGGDHKTPETRKFHRCKQPGHLMQDCPVPPPKLELPNYHLDGNDCTKCNPVKCYNCGIAGHFAASCPNNVLFCAAGARMSVQRTGALKGTYVPDLCWIPAAHRPWFHRNLYRPARVRRERH